MLPEIEKIKDVPPGAVLAWALKKKGIGPSVFAMEIGEYPGIITDITKLRRGITAKLSIKLGQYLNVEDNYFMLLQANYKVRQERETQILRNQDVPDFRMIRKQLFWDIDIDKLDFSKYYGYVILRLFERGNESEIEEIVRFYGKETCRKVIRESETLLYFAAENAVKYLNMKKTEMKCLKNSNGGPYQKPWLGF